MLLSPTRIGREVRGVTGGMPMNVPEHVIATSGQGLDQRFDFARQLARFGDDFWQVSRFARLFTEQAPLRMKAIRVGLAARDETTVREAARAVTELLQALGAPETAAIAEDLARSGRDNDYGRARVLAIALQRHVDVLLATVKTWPPLAAA